MRYLLVAVFTVLAIHAGALAQTNPPKLVAQELRSIVERGETVSATADREDRFLPVYLFYEDRNYTPIWVRDSGPKAKARDFLSAIRSAAEDGLSPDNYQLAAIEQRMGATEPRVLAELELFLTRALLDYGRDRVSGQVRPEKVSRNVHYDPIEPSDIALLDAVERADDVPPVLAALGPASPNYQRLKTKLAELRQLAAKGGWGRVGEGATLKPGMSDPRVGELRDVLHVMGDLSKDDGVAGETYDETLVAAVKRFQERHGLEPDGVVGPGTLAELNVPVQSRIHTIELNMERRRWLQDDLKGYYIFVNLADQVLKVVDNEKTIHTARVVVGKPYHSTPAFTRNMTYLVLNPTWSVPPSIAVNEYLPKLRQDASYLARQNIRIIDPNVGEINPHSVDWSSVGGRFPFRLKQDSGDGNALGRVKFMFPNDFNVYIHDTPSKGLFARTSRAFSHGCVRVQHPLDLAEVLLRDQEMEWDRRKIDAAVAKGREQVVKFRTPVPVFIAYFTAFANKDGTLHFRPDIYGRDKQLDEALTAAGQIRVQGI